MRRWLAVLLLVLLPLQVSWAAVAGYCALESSQAATHLGHHDHAAHEHGAEADDASPTDTSQAATSHFDCGHCHGHCAAMIDGPLPVAAEQPRGAPPRLGDAPSMDPLPAQPERPQWARLA